MTLELEGEPLEDAGFTVQQTWDFSVCDEFEDEDSSAERSPLAGTAESERSEARSEGWSTQADTDETFVAPEAPGTQGSTQADTDATWETLDAIPSGDDIRIALVSKPYTDTATLIAELEQLDFVESAEPNYLLETDDDAADDTDDTDDAGDSGYPTNDALVRLQYPLLDGDGGINLQAALDKAAATGTTDGTVVAVIDSGVDYTHPDLAGNMWTGGDELAALGIKSGTYGYDFGDDDDDPMPAPDNGSGSAHGTHVAGIIAAAANNGEGVAGASTASEIMALKIEPDNAAQLSVSAIVGAYQYVVAATLAGVNVVAVNTSFGGYGEESLVMEYLAAQGGNVGALTVKSAGNNGADADSGDIVNQGVARQTPYRINVAATTENNHYGLYTDYGRASVDVAAPGSNVLSTVPVQDAGAYAMSEISAMATGTLYEKPVAWIAEQARYATLEEAAAIQDGDVLYTIAKPAEDAGLSASYVDAPEYADAVSIAAVQREGRTQLSLNVDLEKLPYAADIESLQVAFYWRDANPYYGMAEDEAIVTDGGVPAAFASDGNPAAVALTSLSVQGDERTAVFNQECRGRDDTYANSRGSLPDVSSERATFAATVDFRIAGVLERTDMPFTLYMDDPLIANGTVPYSYMTGTSMAAPYVSGMVGQLAALYPDASALELRGMVVGGTVPVDGDPYTLQDDDIVTATNGRVDYGTILDGHVNANTWSLSVDATTGDAVLEGYGLQDASLEIEDAVFGSVGDGNLEFSGTPDGLGWLSFSLAGDAFSWLMDGGSHWFTVVDGATGRAHDGYYAVPIRTAPAADDSSGGSSGDDGSDDGSAADGGGVSDATATASLVESLALPDGFLNAASAQLVEHADGLYMADTVAGSYVWERGADGRWNELPAPGMPGYTGLSTLIDGNLDSYGMNADTSIRYVQADGDLVAVASTQMRMGAQATDGRAVFMHANVFSSSAGQWSGWQLLWTFDNEHFSLMGDYIPTYYLINSFDVAWYDGSVWIVALEGYGEPDDLMTRHVMARTVRFDPSDIAGAQLIGITWDEPEGLEYSDDMQYGRLLPTESGLAYLHPTLARVVGGGDDFDPSGALGSVSPFGTSGAGMLEGATFRDGFAQAAREGDGSGESGFGGEDSASADAMTSLLGAYDLSVAQLSGDESAYQNVPASDPVSGGDGMGVDHGIWLSDGIVDDVPAMTVHQIKAMFTANLVMPTLDGAVLYGAAVAGSGDAALVSRDADGLWAWHGLGSFGFDASNGVAAVSAAMVGDVPYFLAVPYGDAGSAAGTAGALYTLDEASASRLRGFHAAVGADVALASGSASSGNEIPGAATVSDWRGAAGSSLDMRRQDHATWAAEAADGYRFAGWLDQDSGDVVSTDATYRAVVSRPVTLTALFEPVSVAPADPGSATTPVPQNPTVPETPVTPTTPAGNVTAAATASVTSLSRTGSEIALVVAAALAALAFGLLLLGGSKKGSVSSDGRSSQ